MYKSQQKLFFANAYMKHVKYIVLKTHVLVCNGNASEYFTIFSILIEYDNAFNY